MKVTVRVTKDCEFDITFVRITVPVNYGEEDMPNDFPFRKNGVWDVTVVADTGRIVMWPKGKTADIYMKVVDEGDYYLLNDRSEVIAALESEYVPHGVVPGEYGDYIELHIAEDGTIKNWPRKFDVRKFFGEEEE